MAYSKHSRSTRNKCCVAFIIFLVVLTLLFTVISEYDLRDHKWKYLYISDLPDKYQVLQTDRYRPVNAWQPGPKYPLVDPVEPYLKNYTGGKLYPTRGFYQILHYNEEVNNHARNDNIIIKRTCAYQNCHFTNDRAQFSNSSAVIFSLSHGKTALGAKLPDKLPGQVWVFYDREPPLINSNWNYRHHSWRNVFNWSWSYRSDSDIVYPYGKFTSRRPHEIPIKDYSLIYKSKTKFAFAVISSCQGNVFSERAKYIDQLRKHIPVDIYGNCGSGKITKKELKQFLKEYYFHLSIENSFCLDYVSEKVFRRFNHDIVLVTRGSVDYDRTLPLGTYIDSSKFANPSALTDFLKRVSSSEKLYTSYLKSKNEYRADFTLNWQCQMCAKLNNQQRYAHVHDSIVSFWNVNACWKPTDIESGWPNVYITLSPLLIVIILIRYVWNKYRASTHSRGFGRRFLREI